jgi:NAD(P)-dependent dehydrogenase (short-subunit alcohol dehydrogenase family)
MMTTDDQQPHVLFIGGLGTIGRVLCPALRQRGYIVTVADFVPTPDAPETIKIDIRDAQSVHVAIASAAADSGPITAIINCAYPRNKAYGQAVEDVTYDNFAMNVSWHLGGYFIAMQQACLHFKAQKQSGAIINFSSIYGLMAPRFEIYDNTAMLMPVEYAAIKSSIMHLTRYFAQTYKTDGIRLNTISPGGILDNQDESFLAAYNTFCGQKGMLDPIDLVGTIDFLVGEGSRYVTGQNITVDDGFSL